MGKITWFYFGKNDEEVYKKILHNTPYLNFDKENSELLIHDDGKIQETFHLEIFNLNLTERDILSTLSDLFMKILKAAHKDAVEKFSEKGSSEVVPGKSEDSIISSLLLKWSYNSDDISVLSCAAQLMYRYVNEHIYENANKRTALLLTLYFLRAFSIYISFDVETYEVSDWRKKLSEIVENEQNGKPEEDQIKDLEEWIEERSVIIYNLTTV